ncbi:MAG: 50S ribosomal protein L4 [Pseudomonadota bacterium]
MINEKLIDVNNNEVGKVDLSEDIFNCEVNEGVVHEVLISQLAGNRRGNASTKTRGEVRGGGAKPYKQKGTGRARRGTERSPICVGGGTVFGPIPRSYKAKLNKKVVKAALKMVFTDKLKNGKIRLVEKFEMEKPNTKVFKSIMQKLDLPNALVVDFENESLKKSLNNLIGYHYSEPVSLSMYNLLKYDALVISKNALEKITERLK